MCILLTYKTIKRDTKRINLIFACFYLFAALGLAMNFIYVPLTAIRGLENIVLILNFLTIFFISFGLIFLVVFQIILLKSEKVFTTKKQLILIAIYALVLLSLMFFLPFEGVIFDDSTDWMAAFSLPFYLYLVTILTSGAVIPSLYLSLKINRRFEDPQLKKKWKHFIYGMIFIFIFMYTTYTLNFLNRTNLRSLWMSISGIIGMILLILVISGAYLVYYGVGKQIE